jgi:predicted nucleic acid-binding protein
MAVTFLVDTSVLTRVHQPSVVAELERLHARGVSRASISDLELGFSARNAVEWDTIQTGLLAFRPIDVEPHHLRRAGQVQRLLAARGLRGRKLPDLIVAACAEDHGLTVLHYDTDFDHIGSVTEQPVQWVVPAGSID